MKSGFMLLVESLKLASEHIEHWDLWLSSQELKIEQVPRLLTHEIPVAYYFK